MKKLIVLLILTFVLLSCTKHHNTVAPTEPEIKGSIPLPMNLSPAFEHGYTVTRVNVRIMKDTFNRSQDLAVNDTLQTAQGIFEDLAPGLYSVFVKVYEDTLLLATGYGEGQVMPGQNSTVHITMQFVPGLLTVVVDWGDVIPSIPRKILFVGNSHTYYNGGISTHIQGLVNTYNHFWNTFLQERTVGGYSLEQHYNNPATIAAIQNTEWDLVVLQEQGSRPMDYPDLFYQYGTLLNGVITATGAKTGFYMTHPWPSRPGMADSIAFAYTKLGAELGALVCPAGLAWKNAYEHDSTQVLISADGSHAAMKGTYLTSCVIFASIWNKSPVGLSYVPLGISEADKLFLQTMAWETVCEYFGISYVPYLKWSVASGQ